MRKAVVLSCQSIFVEGVVARLKQHLDEQLLIIVDAYQPGALEQVIEAQPALVILDAREQGGESSHHLGALLEALPWVTLIRLRPERGQVQVVTSQQRDLSQVHDLVEVIKSTAQWN